MPSLRSLRDVANFAFPAATSVISGISNRNAAGKATNILSAGGQQGIDTIQAGADRARGTLGDIWHQQQDLLNPFVHGGQQASDTLSTGVQPGGSLVTPFSWVPADLQNDPIFQRRLKMGMDAINAAGNAGGTRFTGASMKDFGDYATGAANDYLAQDYARHEATFRANQKTQLEALQDVANRGLNAASAESSAGSAYGANTANLEAGTAKAVADLQTEIASAQAAGDVAKANTLQQTLDGITSGIQQGQVLQGLTHTTPPTPGPQPGDPDFVGPVQQAAGAAGTGATLASAAPEIGAVGGVTGPVGATAAPAFAMPAAAPLGATGALAAPEIAAPAIASGAAAAGGAFGLTPGMAGFVGPVNAAAAGSTAAAGGAAGSGGLGASMGAFFSNPVTIGVGLAIAGALLWRHSQVHPTADTFVQQYQKPFEAHLRSVVNAFDQAYASGQLDKATAQQLYDQTAEFIRGFDEDTAKFKTQGGKERTVADQAKQTMASWAGPNWEKVLGKMQQEIQGLS